MEEFVTESGEIDFDKLNSIEREEYLKMLTIVQGSKITLEDFKKHVKVMRQSLENALLKEPEFIYSPMFPFFKRYNTNVILIKARLQNYLIFEAFFEKPELAKAQLDQYKKRLGVKKL